MAGLNKADPEKQKNLFVGGHSLGAGMSQVASAKLVFMEKDRQPLAVYNFGCPRALDFDGADLYNERLGSSTYRVVNNNDVVCKVPLKVMGFSHVGQQKYLTSKGKILSGSSRWRLFKEGLWGRFRGLTGLNPVDFVTDHLPKHYVRSLKQLISKQAQA